MAHRKYSGLKNRLCPYIDIYKKNIRESKLCCGTVAVASLLNLNVVTLNSGNIMVSSKLMKILNAQREGAMSSMCRIQLAFYVIVSLLLFMGYMFIAKHVRVYWDRRCFCLINKVNMKHGVGDNLELSHNSIHCFPYYLRPVVNTPSK